jgi:hypothetical protein
MGRARGCAVSRPKREAMLRNKIPEILVYNKQTTQNRQ